MSTTTVPGSRGQGDHSVGSFEAAVVHDFHAPLTIEQVPFSPLGPDQIRVQIEACGLCHTDIHAAHGDWPVKPAPPFTPGHLRQVNEAIADVEAGRVVARVVLQP